MIPPKCLDVDRIGTQIHGVSGRIINSILQFSNRMTFSFEHSTLIDCCKLQQVIFTAARSVHYSRNTQWPKQASKQAQDQCLAVLGSAVSHQLEWVTASSIKCLRWNKLQPFDSGHEICNFSYGNFWQDLFENNYEQILSKLCT